VLVRAHRVNGSSNIDTAASAGGLKFAKKALLKVIFELDGHDMSSMSRRACVRCCQKSPKASACQGSGAIFSAYLRILDFYRTIMAACYGNSSLAGSPIEKKNWPYPLCLFQIEDYTGAILVHA